MLIIYMIIFFKEKRFSYLGHIYQILYIEEVVHIHLQKHISDKFNIPIRYKELSDNVKF
jgi:hypothetical protein